MRTIRAAVPLTVAKNFITGHPHKDRAGLVGRYGRLLGLDNRHRGVAVDEGGRCLLEGGRGDHSNGEGGGREGPGGRQIGLVNVYQTFTFIIKHLPSL